MHIFLYIYFIRVQNNLTRGNNSNMLFNRLIIILYKKFNKKKYIFLNK